MKIKKSLEDDLIKLNFLSDNEIAKECIKIAENTLALYRYWDKRYSDDRTLGFERLVGQENAE